MAEIRGETKFGGRWAWVPMHPPPKKKHNFGATPLISDEVGSELRAHNFFKDF